MTGLTEFCAARLDERAAGAWSVHDVAKCDALLYEDDMGEAARRTPDCDCGQPARTLREVEAGRAILAAYEANDSDVDLHLGPDARKHGEWDGLRLAVRQLAAIASDHPDYDEAWRP